MHKPPVFFRYIRGPYRVHWTYDQNTDILVATMCWSDEKLYKLQRAFTLREISSSQFDIVAHELERAFYELRPALAQFYQASIRERWGE